VAQGGAHIGVAQHAGELTRARLARDDLHVTRRDPASRSLRYHQVMIRVGTDLGEMRDHERLPAPGRSPRHRGERLPDSGTHLTPDALIHLIEYQRRDGVVLRQHDFERQHQP